MKNKKRYYLTISFKLIVMISAIQVLTALGITYLATYFFQDNYISRIQEVTSDKSLVIGLKVKADINSIIDSAHFIALGSGMALPGTGYVGQRTLRGALPSEAFRKLFLERENGIIHVSAVRQGQGEIIIVSEYENPVVRKRIPSAAPDYLTILREDAVLFQQAFHGVASIHNASSHFQAPVLALAMPFRTGSGVSSDTILVVYFSMDVFMESVQSYTEYITYIVNNKGELIAHPDADFLLQNIDYSNNELVQAMLRSPLDNGQISYADETDREQIGSFYKVAFADLGIVCTVEKDTALAVVYALRLRNVLIAVIILAFSMIVIYAFSKTVTNPILKLAAAVEKMGEGVFAFDLKPASRDEVGDLTAKFLEMGKGLEEREQIKAAFGKFINKDIAELAMKSELKLGGERKKAAILFSDIRNFTAISENLNPEEVVGFLNEYMTMMVACVEESFGVVDKYIGDAVMAVWGTPVSKGNDTENAINGALLMRSALLEYNKGRGGPKKPVIRIGCGINTGSVLAGQIGSQNHMEYTVIGDAVNLASRVESLNKIFGTDILISEDSRNLVKNIFHLEPMRPITVKGKIQPQNIFAVIGRTDNPAHPQSLKEVRDLLGILYVDLESVNPDAVELKYEL